MKRAFPCRYIKRRIWYLFATECGTFLKQLLICVALLNYEFFASILIYQLENNGTTMHVMKIILIIMLGNACEINNNTDNYQITDHLVELCFERYYQRAYFEVGMILIN